MDLQPAEKTSPETVVIELQDNIISVRTLPKGEIKLMEALKKNNPEKTGCEVEVKKPPQKPK